MSATDDQIKAGARAMCSLNYLRQLQRVEYEGLDVREREHWEDLARVCLTVALPSERIAKLENLLRAILSREVRLVMDEWPTTKTVIGHIDLRPLRDARAFLDVSSVPSTDKSGAA